MSFIFFLFKNHSFTRINIFWINITFIFSVLINPWYSVVILWYLFSNIIFLYKTFDKKEKKIIINTIIILIIELILFVILFNPGNQLVFPYISNVKIISRFHHIFLYWGFSFLTISISISYLLSASRASAEISLIGLCFKSIKWTLSLLKVSKYPVSTQSLLPPIW